MIPPCRDRFSLFAATIKAPGCPENDEKRERPAKQNFKNTAEDAYTG